jgi:hypothetical protein
MNRANQEALFQATNQGLLSIRQSEINYYQSLNVAFGTQAALIGGFTYGVFSQNQINYDNNYDNVDILADVYWVCSAITIALSVHVILCTMLMQVLGPGLALNGPVGSMARATEGMRLEQKQLIWAFIAMMIMFSVSTVLSCWVVMSFEASIGCSIAFAVASCYWYKYCERIYLRFYWESEEAGWDARNNSFDDLSEQEPTVPHAYKETIQAKETAGARKKESKRRNVFNFLSRNKKQPEGAASRRVSKESTRERENSSTVGQHPLKRTLTSSSQVSDYGGTAHGNLPVNASWAAASANRGVVMEGYLTKRGGGTKMMDFRNEPWERRYFTLTATACFFIYKTRHDYRNDPKSPIYTRPLRLYEYYIEVNNSDWDTNEGTEIGSVAETAVTLKSSRFTLSVPDDKDIKPHRFQMTLVLRENAEPAPVMELDKEGASNPMRAQSMRAERYRDHWVLRCDTEEELQLWVGAVRDVCPSCFKSG